MERLNKWGSVQVQWYNFRLYSVYYNIHIILFRKSLQAASPEVLITHPPASFCLLGCDQKLRYDSYIYYELLVTITLFLLCPKTACWGLTNVELYKAGGASDLSIFRPILVPRPLSFFCVGEGKKWSVCGLCYHELPKSGIIYRVYLHCSGTTRPFLRVPIRKINFHKSIPLPPWVVHWSTPLLKSP